MTYHDEIDPILLGSIHDLVSRVACDHLKPRLKSLVGRFSLQGIKQLLVVRLGVLKMASVSTSSGGSGGRATASTKSSAP